MSSPSRSSRRGILLAELGADIVGVASSSTRIDERPGPRLELNSLYVAHGMRSMGLGTRMLDELLGDAPAVVWVFSANSRAISFYEGCGFAQDGHETIDDDTGRPEVRMGRS